MRIDLFGTQLPELRGARGNERRELVKTALRLLSLDRPFYYPALLGLWWASNLTSTLRAFRLVEFLKPRFGFWISSGLGLLVVVIPGFIATCILSHLLHRKLRPYYDRARQELKGPTNAV